MIMGGVLILVVDDSDVVRTVARRILEDLSFVVAEAPDASEALSICRQTMPVALIVDEMIADLDGLDFVRELRQSHGGEQPKVVVCMSEYTLGAATRAKRAGADEHLMKPFDRGTIEGVLQKVGLL